ncbi:unnamed protein product, partial [Polarella glacialis]
MFQDVLDQALAKIACGHEEELHRLTEALCTENASLTRQLAKMQVLLTSTSQLPSADSFQSRALSNDLPRTPAPLEIQIPEPPCDVADNRSGRSTEMPVPEPACDQQSPGEQELQGPAGGQRMRRNL